MTVENISVKVEPATNSRSGPVISRSSKQPMDPAIRRRSEPKLDVGRKIADDIGRPAAPNQTPPPVKPTSPTAPTVLTSEPQSSKRSKDQLGMWLFVLGLGALVGALAYAGILIFTSTSTIHLVVRSEPSGAEIWLDGYNTGLKTPHEIPDVSSDEAHRIELKYGGHKTYVRNIEPAPENRGEPYVINKVLEPISPGKPANKDGVAPPDKAKNGKE